MGNIILFVVFPYVALALAVIGGLISFGVIGLFIGPVVLAVTLTLLQAWVSEAEEESASVSHGE